MRLRWEPRFCVHRRWRAGVVRLGFGGFRAGGQEAMSVAITVTCPGDRNREEADHVARDGMKSLVCRRRGLATLSVAAALLVLGQPVPSLAGSQPPATAPPSAGPFNKVWTYALSQYAQASQTGESLAQLSDGTVVVAGNDAYQPNYCFKPSHPFRGGAWLVAVTSGGGQTSGRSSTRRVPAQRSRRVSSVAPRTVG